MDGRSTNQETQSVKESSVWDSTHIANKTLYILHTEYARLPNTSASAMCLDIMVGVKGSGPHGFVGASLQHDVQQSRSSCVVVDAVF